MTNLIHVDYAPHPRPLPHKEGGEKEKTLGGEINPQELWRSSSKLRFRSRHTSLWCVMMHISYVITKWRLDMRKLIVEVEVSVDGAMGGENAEFWKQIFPFHSPDVTAYLDDLLFMPDALVMGQKTYEFFAQVWPT